MINKAIKVQTPSTDVKLTGSGAQTPGAQTLRSSFYQLATATTTSDARPEDTVKKSGFNPQPAYSSPRSANFGDCRGESLVCSSTVPGGNQAAHTNNNSNSIKRKSISFSASSDFGLKRKNDRMTRQHYILQEENYISKRSRLDIAGESKGGEEGSERETVMTGQSDSTLKVSSGDSDLTAERMAESNSRTSSLDNGCTLKFDIHPQPPPALNDTPNSVVAEAIAILPLNTHQATEILQSINSSVKSGLPENTGIHSFHDTGEAQGLKAPSCKPVTESLQVEDNDRDWLELGLGSGCGNYQAKQTFDRKKTANRSLSITSGIKDGHHQQVYSACNNKAATLPPPSPNTQSTSPILFSFNSLSYQSIRNGGANANSLLLHEDTFINKIGIQKHSDFNYSTPINLPQSSSLEKQRSQNIAAGCSVPSPLKLQWQGAGTSHSNESWQGFYDRLGSTDHFSISEAPRVSGQRNITSCQGRQSHSETRSGLGGKSVGTNAFYQNSELEGTAFPSLQAAARTSCQDTTVLQQAILDQMQWGNRDNVASLSAWGLGQLVRSSPSIAGRRFPSVDRSAYLKQHAALDGKSIQRPFGELRQLPSVLLAENARTCRPSKAQTGLWFMLQASKSQNGDRTLQQIPRPYLRIKDGSMTILVVKKYLVNKLGLNSESEVDITCKGHQVLPSQTLQYVRDVMWSPNFKDEEITLPSSNVMSNYSPMDHLMVLHYQKHQVEIVMSIL